MEMEVVDLFEAAKKAADAAAVGEVSVGGPEVVRCVDALKQLKDTPITYDILVSSQVGKKLRPLTKHPQEKIKLAASELLELWKKIVIEETAKNKKNGTTTDKIKSLVKTEKVLKVESVINNDSPRPQNIVKSETIKIEKKTVNGNTNSFVDEKVKVEKTSIDQMQKSNVKAPPKLTSLIKCNDSMRDKVRELLVEALSKVASEADEDIANEVSLCDPIRVAVAVESILFEKMGKSNGNQKYKYRSIMFNIKDPNNTDFRRRVLLGEIKPDMLITMTPDEMASDQRKQENNKIQEKALFECERGGQAKASTDQFKCGRCGQRKCTYYQMQTRSADEPMTTYVTCVNCNNRWKFC